MIKPKKLKKGDKVAIVSLSSGSIGEKELIHKFYLGKKRTRNIYRKKEIGSDVSNE